MEERIVYIVWSDVYEEADIEGIFSSYEKAEDFVKKNYKDWFIQCLIERYVLDDEACDSCVDKRWRIEGYEKNKKSLIEDVI